MKLKDDPKAYAIMGCAMRVHDTLGNGFLESAYADALELDGRFMRRSRIPKHSCRHIYSRCEVRSCGAVAGARTLGVNFKGRMGAGNPLSPRHADSIRAACKLRSL